MCVCAYMYAHAHACANETFKEFLLALACFTQLFIISVVLSRNLDINTQ